MKVIEATKGDLGMLYGSSALTWEGMATDEENLGAIDAWFRAVGAEPRVDYAGYAVSGSLMNEVYGLTGDNRYPGDLTILAFPLHECFAEPMPLIGYRFSVGARWFDDMVDNNARREG